MRKEKQYRTISTDISQMQVREAENSDLYLEGYFVVFGVETELWKGAYEEIDSGALNNTLDNDIRCLINHDTTFVLGRNKAGTLELRIDEKGLWGRVKINEKDTDALNVYERVKRGDVTGNSFGFAILQEETDYREDGTIKWTITEVELFEVSVCTFPAYEETTIQARKAEFEEHKKRKMDVKKTNIKERLKKLC